MQKDSNTVVAGFSKRKLYMEDLTEKEKRRLIAKRHYEKNKASIKARTTEYGKLNKDKLNAAKRQDRSMNKAKWKAVYLKNYEKSRTKSANRIRRLIAEAVRRAMAKHLPYDIAALNKLLVDTAESCSCCGTSFSYGLGRLDSAPSIDRLVCSAGYAEGNIYLICTKCNRLKSDGTLRDVLNIAKYITRFSGSSNLGAFDTQEDAALVYNDAAFKAWGNLAYLNILEDHPRRGSE